MFNLAIDSKLRGCDLVNLRVQDVMHADQILRPSDGRAAEDPTTGAIRTDRADQVRRLSMDRKGEFEGGALSVPQSPGEIAACLHAPVCPDRASVGRRHRTRFDGLWHAQHATDQGDVDLQTNQEPEGRSTLAWPHQTGKHREIPWIEVDDALEISEQTEI